MTILHTLFGLSGRLGRRRYLVWSLLCSVIVGLLGMLALMIAFGGPESVGLTAGTANIAFVLLLAAFVVDSWAGVALAVKRLHDIGQPGAHVIWITLVAAGASYTVDRNQVLGTVLSVGVLGIYLGLVLIPGTAGPNAYGSEPE